MLPSFQLVRRLQGRMYDPWLLRCEMVSATVVLKPLLLPSVQRTRDLSHQSRLEIVELVHWQKRFLKLPRVQ